MQDTTESRLRAFARKHPIVSVVGAAGIALLGGVEVAAGVLAGAGLATILQRRSSEHVSREGHHLPDVIRDRARAVVDAAFGKARHTDGESTVEPPAPHP